ncbi:MAG: FAD-dependent oxidoreductase [Planctomycetota bacterium]|nr:FAD-dependent oxidoreductase [Planctomycetota bacterium]
MKIAIVGSGISGLFAASKLHSSHDITLFEANDYVGGHTHTIRVELDGEVQEIDTGFIVYNRENYPEFEKLLTTLAVPSQPTQMSFSVSDSLGSLEYNGTNLNRLFAQRTNLFRPKFCRMIRDIIQFGRDLKVYMASGHSGVTVEDFIQSKGYSRLFEDRYLVPLGSALWSCPTATFKKFPIQFVGDFLNNHFMLQVRGRPKWRVVVGGSSRYVEKLILPFENRIRKNCPVASVHRTGHGVKINSRFGTEEFDHVVLACHADQALQLLADPSEQEQKHLKLFPYQENQIFLHTDSSVLPKRKLAWASWNAKIFENTDHPKTVVTYNMNILQSLKSRHTYCVTLNDSSVIDPKQVIKSITYHHPLFTVSRQEALEKQGELLYQNHTSFCGAYWGFGFHEDGIQSALRVVQAIDQNAAVEPGTVSQQPKRIEL